MVLDVVVHTINPINLQVQGTLPCVLPLDGTNQAASPDEHMGVVHHRLDFPRSDCTYWGQYTEHSTTSSDGKDVLVTVPTGRACLIGCQHCAASGLLPGW